MSEQSERPTQLVVVGSSAGGIDALSKLISTLPDDLPVPVVLAQHLAPQRESHLAEILAARSQLTIKVIGSSSPERLEPGTIYVVPANRHVEISDQSVRLTAHDHGRAKPSIDRLLSTAAAIFEEGLVAVILTGTGSDGTAGARDVKAAGGTVIIQNPETARYPQMPLSLAPTTVDISANVEDIGPIIHDLVTGAYVPSTSHQDGSLRQFLDQLREQCGIDFTAYKEPTILRRLQRRIVSTGTQGLDGYMRYVQRNPEEFQRLLNSFLIKVTGFFRDDDLFDHLRSVTLPELIEGAKGRGELRLWSAGCATGEEAYSLAMVVADHLGDHLNKWTVRIFATDLDANAVAYARRGVYSAAELADLPDEARSRHFVKHEDNAYEVSKRVRNLVVFGQHDLGQRAPFPRIDLALCRNVLIYFTSELQKRALQLFAYSLRPDGLLVLGKAESVSPFPKYFAVEDPQLKIYRRVGGQVLIPPSRTRVPTPLIQSRRSSSPPPGPGAERSPRQPQQQPAPRQKLASDRADWLVQQFPVGIVVVDRRYDIQLINNSARLLLGIHTSAVGEDFIHQIQTASLMPIRDAINSAFLGEAASDVYPIEKAETISGELRYLEITCYPLRFDPNDAQVNDVMITIQDVTSEERARQVQAETLERRESDARKAAEQIRRLTETNRTLLAANQELTNVNSRLRGAHEEMLLTAEEAQAATEEVETLNEELQATNEELETLNEELQATNEELNTTTDDLEARSVELQDLAVRLDEQRRASDAERARLETVLVSMADAVLVVDSEGNKILTNAAYDLLFGDSLDFEPQDERGQTLPQEDWPQKRASRGEPFSVAFTLPGEDGNRRWFEAYSRPIQSDGEHTVSVIVIRDITERSLRRLQDEFLAMASHEMRTPLTALQGALQMLRRFLPEDENTERSRHYAMIALGQAQRMTTQVNDLLDVARLESGQLTISFEPVDLGELVHHAAASAQVMTSDQTINLDVPAEQLWVNADAGRIEQVLLNLLTNAMTYGPDSDRIDVHLQREGDTAEIHVQDYGIGIPDNQLPVLFSRFSQVERPDRPSRSGLGLGLFITRQLVTAHCGQIDVDSTFGEGSTFTIRLPLSTRGEEAATTPDG